MNNRDSTLITPDNDVAQYIRGYKIRANTPWDKVDYVCIPINVVEACHWVLAVFSLEHRCLYIFDSLSEVGSIHTPAVLNVVKKLSEIIPLFFIVTGFYGKKDDIDCKNSEDYDGCAASDKLSDCGLYTCVFAEFICQGYLNIAKKKIVDSEFCHNRYGTLLWDYDKRKIDCGTISESEVTGSKFGGPKSTREHVLVSDSVPPSNYVPKRKS